MRILTAAALLLMLAGQAGAAGEKTLSDFDFYNDPQWGLTSENEKNFASATLTMINQQACQLTSNVILNAYTAGDAAWDTAQKAWVIYGEELTPERRIAIYNQIWAVLWPALRSFTQPEFNRMCIIMREDQKAANYEGDDHQ